MYLAEPRMQIQLAKLRKFTCDSAVCEQQQGFNSYRFPCCAAFLRPTDKLQSASQAFVSSGEHIPICRIDECKSIGERGASILEYKKMRGVSLSSEMFEGLFNTGKIGSRQLDYEELTTLYEAHEVAAGQDTVVIYLQEFSAKAPGASVT